MGRELVALGLAFLLAGILGGAGRRIGLPTIPLFMLAGILVGPFTPGPVLFAHPEDLELLAAFGLIFLLFYLGIEFSIDQLTAGGGRLLASAGVYLALNIGAGLALGFAIGWGTEEALVIAGATGVSSSAIVTKLIVELRRLDNPETKLILGIIVLEDLFLALYLAALAPVLGGADSAGEAALLFARAAGFLIVLGLAARYGTRIDRPDRRRSRRRAARDPRPSGSRCSSPVSPSSSASRTPSARSWPASSSPAPRPRSRSNAS